MPKTKREALAELLSQPNIFRHHRFIDLDGSKVQLPTVIKPWQSADFEALDPSWKKLMGLEPDGPTYSFAWLGRSRGASKTTDAATMVAFALMGAKRPVHGVIAAASKDQARIMVKQIRTARRLNKLDASMLVVDAYRVSCEQTGSDVEVLAADASTSWGVLPDFVLIDELSNWPPSGEELWHSLFSSAAKRASCLTCILTNSGTLDSWQHRIFSNLIELPETYHSETDESETLLSAKQLEHQRKILPPSVFTRLFCNRWVPASSDAIDERALQRCISKFDYPMRGDERPWSFTCGVDIGVSHDHSAVVVLASNSNTNKIRIAFCKRWAPPRGGQVDLKNVQDVIWAISKKYRCVSYFADPFECRALLQSMRRMGLNVQEQTFQGSAAANLASSLLTAINSASLEIPAREVDLLQDLRSLSLVEKSGVWRLVADRSSRGHADQAFALLAAISGAAVLASAGYSGPIEDICPKAVEHPTFLQQNFAARGVLVDNRRRHLSSVIRPQQRGDPRIERTAGLFPRRN